MLDGEANTGPIDLPVALRQSFGKVHVAINAGNTSRLRFHSSLYAGLTCHSCVIGADAIEPDKFRELVEELHHQMIGFFPEILQSEAAATAVQDKAGSGLPVGQMVNDRGLTRSLSSDGAPSPAPRG